MNLKERSSRPHVLRIAPQTSWQRPVHGCPTGLFFFGGSVGRRSHTHNLQHARLVLRAVVVYFFGIVDDETARWDGLEAGRIVFRTGIHPPRSGKDGYVTVVRMEMRTAVMMRKPLLQNHITAGLGRIAQQYGCLSAGIRI